MTKLIISTLAVILLLSGCSKNPEARNALNDLPQWYQEPTVLGDKYAASGSAKPNKANDIELQRIEASAVARAELVRQMEIRIKDMYKRATQELGSGEDQTIDHAVQYATKQVSDATLLLSSQKKVFLDSRDGVMYVLIAADETMINAIVKGSVRSSFYNQDALWQKFQATQVWQELEGQGIQK